MKYIMFSKFSNQFKLDILIFSCPSRFNHESNYMKQKMTKPPLDRLEFEVISLGSNTMSTILVHDSTQGKSNLKLFLFGIEFVDLI